MSEYPDGTVELVHERLENAEAENERLRDELAQWQQYAAFCKMVEVPLDDLLALLELAENEIWDKCSEYGRDPIRRTPKDEDRDLMLAMWKLAGKSVPAYFSRTYGWKLG